MRHDLEYISVTFATQFTLSILSQKWYIWVQNHTLYPLHGMYPHNPFIGKIQLAAHLYYVPYTCSYGQQYCIACQFLKAKPSGFHFATTSASFIAVRALHILIFLPVVRMYDIFSAFWYKISNFHWLTERCCPETWGVWEWGWCWSALQASFVG